MPAGFFQNIYASAVNRLLPAGATIAAIFFSAFIISRFAHAAIVKVVQKVIVTDKGLSKKDRTKRNETLVRVLGGAVKISLWSVAIMMSFSELGLQIGPMLAAAGVAGMALGFGGQYLIRDLISGLFIILENQYRVGDLVSIGDTSGVVEDISLRMTVIRDLDGTVHHIPNGEIKISSNLSKDFARVNINIGISYDADLEKVIRIVDGIGKELATDPQWKDSIISAPKFLRVEEFGDSSVIIKILGETRPSRQWAVAGELRKRIKIGFDREGIEIPFPQRVIHQAEK